MDIDFREALYLLAVGMCVGSVLFCTRTVNLQQLLLSALQDRIDILHAQLEVEHGIVAIIERRLVSIEEVVFPARTGPHVH